METIVDIGNCVVIAEEVDNCKRPKKRENHFSYISTNEMSVLKRNQL